MIETTLCYIFNEDKVLMLYRNKKENDFHEGKWNGLGGKIEKGELALDGVKREVLEEAGLVIEHPKLVGVCYFPSFDNEEEFMYVYIAKNYIGELIECDEGELEWVQQDHLLQLNVWESDQVFLPYVLREEFFIGNFCFSGKELKSYDIQSSTELELRKFAIKKGSQSLKR